MHRSSVIGHPSSVLSIQPFNYSKEKTTFPVIRHCERNNVERSNLLLHNEVSQNSSYRVPQKEIAAAPLSFAYSYAAEPAMTSPVTGHQSPVISPIYSTFQPFNSSTELTGLTIQRFNGLTNPPRHLTTVYIPGIKRFY